MARSLARLLLPRVLVACLVTVALTVLFSLPGSTVRADGSFDSTLEYHFCNALDPGFNGPAPLPGNPSCTDDYSAGAHPDFGFTWDVPAGDYNFATFAYYMSDEFDVAADADIDDGTVVGGLATTITLGLASSPCNNNIYPDFILYDSTTDTSDTVNAQPEGTPDRFSVLATDTGDAFPGQADADSPGVLQYPSFLNNLFDPDLDYPGGPDGPIAPISPHARYTGLTQVPPGDDWIFLTILVFEKAQLLPFANDPDNATHPFARYGGNPDEAGWVHVYILQDPSETVGRVQPISDFCSPLVAQPIFLGQVTDTTHGPVDRLTSPAAGTGIDSEGTHLLLLYSLSYRDTDSDGYENPIDTCPFTANVDDPRATSGTDFDMLDPACDPGPMIPENGFDFDDDDFLNSQDNCPLVSNVTQGQMENTTTHIAAAPDGGFKADQIGDPCDSEQGGADAVSNGPFLHDMKTDAVCIGGVDTTPADGFCDAGGMSGSTIDTDGDGFPNDDEIFMQTDPLIDCPQVSGSHDAWPSDFDYNRVVNITDVFKVLPPVFGSSTGQPNYSKRADLAPNGVINITDVFKVLPPIFGSSCVP